MSALKNARNEAGLTIEAVSKAFGIPGGYLSEIENGKRNVSAERAAQIAKFYEKNIDDIFVPSRYAVKPN